MSHYLRAPALSWNALLNMTKVELGLISDAGIYLFLKKVLEVELLAFLRGIVKPSISI